MTAIIEAIDKAFVNFQIEASKNANGNKAAGVRARKASVEIEKLLKEYRKRSLHNEA